MKVTFSNRNSRGEAHKGDQASCVRPSKTKKGRRSVGRRKREDIQRSDKNRKEQPSCLSISKGKKKGEALGSVLHQTDQKGKVSAVLATDGESDDGVQAGGGKFQSDREKESKV